LAGLPSIEAVTATQKIITKKLNSVLAIEILSAEGTNGAELPHGCQIALTQLGVYPLWI
jgi:hypothetical protein